MTMAMCCGRLMRDMTIPCNRFDRTGLSLYLRSPGSLFAQSASHFGAASRDIDCETELIHDDQTRTITSDRGTQ